MNILVHLRPGEKHFYLNLAKKSFPKAEITTFSDDKGLANIWTGDYIYKKEYKVYFDKNVTQEIITRCRFLRNLDTNIADQLVHKLAVGFDCLFNTNKFDFILGGLIDCYVQDVMERVAKKYGILYVSFVGHFFEGYTRISKRGELNNLPRVVSEDEVKLVLDKILTVDFKPNFSINSEKNTFDLIYIYTREMIKKYIYFPFKKVLNHDKLNYHYNTVINTNLITSSAKIKVEGYFKWLKDFEYKIDSNYIYFPLHYTPEATIDYWADDASYAYQEEMILNTIKTCEDDITLVIKEHPAMYLLRSANFYKKISEYKNVIIVHPYESSNKIIELVDYVCVITGSVGVESLIRGKKVVSLSKNYYSDLHPNIKVVKKIDHDVLNFPIVEYSNEVFIKSILQGLFKATFYNNKQMFLSDVDGMSSSLRVFVEHKLGFKNEKV